MFGRAGVKKDREVGRTCGRQWQFPRSFPKRRKKNCLGVKVELVWINHNLIDKYVAQ